MEPIREHNGDMYDVQEWNVIVQKLNMTLVHDDPDFDTLAKLAVKLKELQKPVVTDNTGASVDLKQQGNFCNMAAPSLENTIAINTDGAGSTARVLISTMGKTQFTLFSGGVVLSGSDFEADEIFDVFIEDVGNQVNVFYLKR